MKNLLVFLLPLYLWSAEPIELGIDRLFSEYAYLVRGKRLGLVTNHTGVNRHQISTIDICRTKGHLVALFGPEHGIQGSHYAGESVKGSKSTLPIYSLHGDQRRPTKEQLQDLDTLIYDIQDIGSRPYTYATTLFYVMEEAAKHQKSVIVLDRPNPLGGQLIDGPSLDLDCRSFVGYIDVPYCHGMTIGELARFFNAEYHIGCDLTVVPLKGWQRHMTYAETGLCWVPTSPHIPEADTAFYYATTGALGELEIVNIGVGYTLPFKVVGAPWIDAENLASQLNQKHIKGVYFLPFHYKPFYGSLKNTECHGIKIQITNPKQYRPFTVQYHILGALKALYPDKIATKIAALDKKKTTMFNHAMGNKTTYPIFCKETRISEKLLPQEAKTQKKFSQARQQYLLYSD